MAEFEITVDTNAAEVSDFMRSLFADQVPFAVATAINRTARDFQDAQRDLMRDRFTIRRPWVLQGVKINRGDFATKTKLEARVHIDPARDFLVKFEEGDTKRPRGSRIAVPQEARRTKTGVVSRTQRPRALKFVKWGEGAKAVVFRGEKRTWMVQRKGGGGEIYQRIGRRRAGKTRTGRQMRRDAGSRLSTTRRLFIFTPEADTPDTLNFEETARRTVQDRFDANFSDAFDRAVRTAR